jgi:glycine cleavage system regulatory protein
MNVHDEIETLTDVYLAGGLEADERRGVEEHAAGCEKCAAILRDAREFHGWMRGASESGAPPASLEERIIERLHAASPKARRFPRAPRIIRILGGLAAVFALIVLGSAFTGTGVMGSRATDVALGLHATAGVEDSQDGYSLSSRDLSEGTVQNQEGARYGGRSGGKGAELRKNLDELKSLKDAAAPRSRSAAPSAPPPMEAEKKMAESMDKAEAGEESLGKNDADGKPGDPGNPFIDDRKIIRNAELHIEVEKYEDAYAKVTQIAIAEKGFVAGANTTRLANGKMRADITIRIPPDRFEGVLTQLKALGTLRNQAITSQDVTKQYLDLATRQKSKEALVERLKKALLEGKGNVKEIMEAEVALGKATEELESIKGELKYYDNLIGLSTITLHLFEKDLGLPFEYVLTLQSTIGVTDPDADGVYAKAQETIRAAGGQVADARMTRQNDGSSSGFIRGKVDAEKFPAVREALKGLAKHVDQDTVNQQQTGRGGQGPVKPDAPVRKEQAVIDFTVNTPAMVVTRRAAIAVEADPAEAAYQAARRAVEEAGGKILEGSVTGRTEGATATVTAQLDADKFAALVEKFKSLGKVKSATVKQDEPGGGAERAPLIRERGEIALTIATPPRLLTEEHGVMKTIRETFANSIAGVLWSIEKLIVGIALAGPWIVLLALIWILWKRWRRARVQSPTA